MPTGGGPDSARAASDAQSEPRRKDARQSGCLYPRLRALHIVGNAVHLQDQVIRVEDCIGGERVVIPRLSYRAWVDQVPRTPGQLQAEVVGADHGKSRTTLHVREETCEMTVAEKRDVELAAVERLGRVGLAHDVGLLIERASMSNQELTSLSRSFGKTHQILHVLGCQDAPCPQDRGSRDIVETFSVGDTGGRLVMVAAHAA